MYRTTIKGNTLYQTESNGYGESVQLFGKVEDGETPMSLVNIALASCVAMCVQGYFNRYHGQKNIDLNVESTYENEQFNLQIHVKEKLDENLQQQVLAYVEEQCRVKKLLRSDVVVTIKI